ncbi:MAG: RidA family protein [SAR202 cluster bacterium]|nr:RidA family protein [SAR202 cluster bacterium]
MNARRVFSGAPWEKQVGYCRAVRLGGHIFVSGTAASDGKGGVHAPGDAYAQAKRCWEIVQKALRDVNADTKHVVRTRMFVTDISRWEEYGRAHREFFGEHPPATAMLEVKGLIHPDMLIEVEADALAPT